MDRKRIRQADRLRLQLLDAGRATVDELWNGYVVNPPFSRLYYIFSGTAHITVGEDKLSLQPGRWYLLPAGCSFEYECVGHMDHMYFHLKVSDFDEVDLLSVCAAPQQAVLPHETVEQLLNEDTVVAALRLRHEVERILLELPALQELAVTGEDYSPCIFAALQYIKQNLSMQLTVNDIAAAASVSVSTLTKRFRKELSLSVGEYIDLMVLFEVERRVKRGEESMREISERYGFSDQFYFSKRFRQAFGVSPREYRYRKSL